ncbi:MAG: rhomboid family intramembrane serine protease [Burkholderiales bacterium]
MQRVVVGWGGAGSALVLAALILVLTWLPATLQQQAALQRDVLASGQLWQLWSGQVVHWSALHAAADALGVAAAGWLAGALYGPARVARWLLAAAPLLSLGILACQPELASYRGASGLVVGLGSLAWVGLWRTATVRRRWLVLVALAFVFKLALAWHAVAMGLPVAGFGLPEGVSVAWSAHVLGALLGLAAGALRTAPDPRTPAPHR